MPINCATRFAAPVRFKMAATSEGVGGTPADPGEWFGGAKEAEKLTTLASVLTVAVQLTAILSAIRSPRRRGRAASAARSRPSALAVLRLIDQLVLGRRLHRQVGRLLALEDAVDVAGRAPVLVDRNQARRRSGRQR